MGDKKNIDQLFQDKFKDFEAVPNDAVWDTIQSELDENNSNRKLIPLWMMYSGVAIILLFFVGFSVSLLSVDEKKERIVVAPEAQGLINGDKVVSSGIDKNDSLLVNQNSNKIVDIGLNNDSIASVDVVDLNKAIVVLNNESYKILNTVVSTAEKSKSNTWDLNDEKNKGKQFMSSHLLKEKMGFVGKNPSEIIAKNTKLSEVAEKQFDVLKVTNNTNLNKDVLLLNKSDVVVNDKGINKSKSAIFSDDLGGDRYSIKKDVVSEREIKNRYVNLDNKGSVVVDNGVQIKETNGSLGLNSSVVLEGENQSTDGVGSTMIVDSGIENSTKILSTSEEVKGETEEECVEEEIEVLVEKTIEEAIAELEEDNDDVDKDEEELVFNKWKIAPNIAPVYYNTLSSGSPINSELSGNKKKGKINMSYGIGVGYAINKKLTVRTGINKVSLGFDTEDVAVNTNSETVGGTRGMKNINLSPAVASLNVASSESFSVSQIPSTFSTLYNSSLNQRLGYLEVPVELSYKISDKKMKIDIIAGVSTFFLNENDIYTETNGIETHIGEANNLNKMSYSTNIGLGFNYNISKSFNFNFEPTFKYQLNAFSNDSGNFKPYILGVYTGFSFKF